MNSCCFCDVDPMRILMENEHAIAIRGAFPVSEGHVLVVPRRHVCTIFELELREQLEIWTLVRKARSLCKTASKRPASTLV
jgi:diadenosine tetraphosphate (Ap4A) HIT family hydrolase